MKAEEFNNGDRVLVMVTEWNSTDKTKKPIKVERIEEYIISVSRGKRYIDGGKHGKGMLKNFKKDSKVKGSFGMMMWKNSWLNFGFTIIGGIDAIREHKLQELGV